MTLADVGLRRTSLALDDGWSFVADPNATLDPTRLPAGRASASLGRGRTTPAGSVVW